VIPALLTVTASTNPDFELDRVMNNEFALSPNRQHNLRVCYSPKGLRKAQFTISLSVHDNPSADIQLIFTGEGFSEDVIFEGLGDDGELFFQDNVVGQTQLTHFTMRNVCQNDVRFSWTNLPEITFSPRVGQLRRHTSKQITATFISDRPVKYSALKVSCQWFKIELTDSSSPDWDDSMKTIKFVQRNNLTSDIIIPPTTRKFQSTSRKPPKPTESSEIVEQIVFQSPRGPDFDLVRVIEVRPEPSYELISGKPKELSLKLYAISDFIKFE
jgi:hydrocephalus-inducing protein